MLKHDIYNKPFLYSFANDFMRDFLYDYFVKVRVPDPESEPRTCMWFYTNDGQGIGGHPYDIVYYYALCSLLLTVNDVADLSTSASRFDEDSRQYVIENYNVNKDRNARLGVVKWTKLFTGNVEFHVAKQVISVLDICTIFKKHGIKMTAGSDVYPTR